MVEDKRRGPAPRVLVAEAPPPGQRGLGEVHAAEDAVAVELVARDVALDEGVAVRARDLIIAPVTFVKRRFRLTGRSGKRRPASTFDVPSKPPWNA